MRIIGVRRRAPSRFCCLLLDLGVFMQIPQINLDSIIPLYHNPSSIIYHLSILEYLSYITCISICLIVKNPLKLLPHVFLVVYSIHRHDLKPSSRCEHIRFDATGDLRMAKK